MRRAAARGAASAPVAWWIKCDPTSPRHGGWNWPDLFEAWRPGLPYPWSVGTSLSQANARIAQPGDPVFGYAAGEGFRELLALVEVERGSLFVPGEGPARGTAGLPGGFTVALRPVKLLRNPVALASIRASMAGLEPEFFRTRFGSIFKVRAPEFARLAKLVESTNGASALPGRWRARVRSR